jgi:hypothetical protein
MLEWKFRLVTLLALAVSVAAVLGSCSLQLLNYNW